MRSYCRYEENFGVVLHGEQPQHIIGRMTYDIRVSPFSWQSLSEVIVERLHEVKEDRALHAREGLLTRCQSLTVVDNVLRHAHTSEADPPDKGHFLSGAGVLHTELAAVVYLDPSRG